MLSETHQLRSLISHGIHLQTDMPTDQHRGNIQFLFHFLCVFLWFWRIWTNSNIYRVYFLFWQSQALWRIFHCIVSVLKLSNSQWKLYILRRDCDDTFLNAIILCNAVRNPLIEILNQSRCPFPKGHFYWSIPGWHSDFFHFPHIFLCLSTEYISYIGHRRVLCRISHCIFSVFLNLKLRNAQSNYTFFAELQHISKYMSEIVTVVVNATFTWAV